MSFADTIWTWCGEHWILCSLCLAILYGKYVGRRNAEAMRNIPGSLVKQIDTDEAWETAIVAADGKVVVCDFFAYWCGPCAAAAPTFAAWSKDMTLNKELQFWKVDVDGSHRISKTQGVQAMPTFKFYRSSNGKLTELETIQGWRQESILGSLRKYAALSVPSVAAANIAAHSE